MTTDWWSNAPVDSGDRPGKSPEPFPEISVEPPSLDPPAAEPGPEETGPPADRRKKLAVGAAGATVAAFAVFLMMPDGTASTPQAQASASQGEHLPAAGNGVPETSREAASAAPEQAVPKAVTLSSSPAGTGRVGAVVKVRIHNGTDDRVTLIANLVRGDDRPAVIGEGTLAPGAKVIEPGQDAEGTVEFAVGKQPGQVVLVDLSGDIVAAS